MKPRRGENIYHCGEHVQIMVRLAHPDLNAAQRERIAPTTIISTLDDWSLERELQLRPPTSFSNTM